MSTRPEMPSRPDVWLHPQARFARARPAPSSIRLPEPAEGSAAPDEPSPLVEAVLKYVASLP
ncbi:MAG: hypothetical protein INH41_13580 [Myxococcaceae bacterium]|jgi:hypothetical protein|nr:hypothetical protein [Myxococcaceae bacterium]MCA3013412.1 hypothetical protein [Myxococcaceae bacterium]